MLSYSVKENLIKNSSINQYRYNNLKQNTDILLLKLNNCFNIASNSTINKSNDANYKLISRNFFIKFINQFWQETIFLSTTNSATDSYIDKLKLDGLSMYSKEYKNFLIEFSKALINGRINIALNGSDVNILKANNSMYIKYIWRKGLNFSWPNKNSYLLSVLRQLPGAYKSKKFYAQKLVINKLPVFTVVNNLNQIILSESSNEILINKNFIDYLYTMYSKYFLNNLLNNIKHQGLFFINVQDAKEYQNYIKNKYIDLSEIKKIQVSTNQLGLYYKLINSTLKTIDFSLIPDLTELGHFITKYQYYKNIKIHESQKYGSTFFQGQPIYFIEPILAFNKNNKKIELVKYSYSSLIKGQNSEYTAVFMNYKTAVLAWQKFKQQIPNYELPVKPIITVYNLESFLEQSQSDNLLKLRNILFIPSFESYSYLKNVSILNHQSSILQRIINYYSSTKLLSQRILWSLTSRQPLKW